MRCVYRVCVFCVFCACCMYCLYYYECCLRAFVLHLPLALSPTPHTLLTARPLYAASTTAPAFGTQVVYILAAAVVGLLVSLCRDVAVISWLLYALGLVRDVVCVAVLVVVVAVVIAVVSAVVAVVVAAQLLHQLDLPLLPLGVLSSVVCVVCGVRVACVCFDTKTRWVCLLVHKVVYSLRYLVCVLWCFSSHPQTHVHTHTHAHIHTHTLIVYGVE